MVSSCWPFAVPLYLPLSIFEQRRILLGVFVIHEQRRPTPAFKRSPSTHPRESKIALGTSQQESLCEQINKSHHQQSECKRATYIRISQRFVYYRKIQLGSRLGIHPSATYCWVSIQGIHPLLRTECLYRYILSG